MTHAPLTDLSAAAARAQSWMLEACFPFWAQMGPDPRGGFRERLTLEGGAREDATSRVRVQARQTYVFAQAHLMGWEPKTSEALIRRGVDTMLNQCRRPDGLFGKHVALGQGLADDSPDLYDNAFCLYGLSWAALALQDDDILGAARAAWNKMQALLAHPVSGFHNILPPTTPRLQNPHMHTLEALLALHAASGDDAHLAAADAIATLCRTRFFHTDEGRLREVFQEDWTPAETTEEAVIEPGHELEWCWLWGRYAARRGEMLPDIAANLYRAGTSALDARGLAPQSVHVDGRPVDATRRTWPQTEALKAHITMLDMGGHSDSTPALQTFAALFDDYLTPAPAGGWIDHYDADGRPMVDSMTAATGYHVVCAFAELKRVADGLTARAAASEPAGGI